MTILLTIIAQASQLGSPPPNPPTLTPLQTWSLFLGAIGATLGIINTGYLLFTHRERLKITSRRDEDFTTSIYNPMARPIEIQIMTFQVKTKKGWLTDTYDSRLPKAPFTIAPFTAAEFQISPGQEFSSGMLGPARIVLVTSAGTTHTKRLK